jgi:CrcB protein
VAGALGALTRYAIGQAVGVRSFPWATLGINVTGSYALALVLTVALRRHWPEHVTIPLGTGFLGAYTTFSTFSYESMTLLRTDRTGTALAYVACSVVFGVAGAALGLGTGRAIT